MRDKEVRYINPVYLARRLYPGTLNFTKFFNSFYGINLLFSILTWRRPDAKARNAHRQNTRNKEKVAKAANNLKRKEKRELD